MMGFIEGAAYGMSAAVVLIYADFTSLLIRRERPANDGAFNFHRRCIGPTGSIDLTETPVAQHVGNHPHHTTHRTTPHIPFVGFLNRVPAK
jgi:hypothetical protein